MRILNRVCLDIKSSLIIMPETILKHTTKTAFTLVMFAIVFTTLMTYVYQITKTPIEESEAAARMSLFAQIIPDNLHNNDVLKDVITIEPNTLLGNKQPTIANIAKIDGKPTAVILEAIAHDGYGGDIKLLIAIKTDGTIGGVRVIKHSETPGLGDYIDIAKNQWIKLFDGESINKASEEDWKVKKDGGKFDYMVGATITPRAVVKAVAKALTYYNLNQKKLVDTPTENEGTA
jgi:Na+-translocating ferredoxin:NAD+ oxidoreductase subunit G